MRSTARALPKTSRLSSSGGDCVLPVRMARRSIKFSFTLHSWAMPVARTAASMPSWDHSAGSSAVSSSAVKARVSSSVRFLGRKTSGVGMTSSRKRSRRYRPSGRASRCGSGAEAQCARGSRRRRRSGAARRGRPRGELAEIFAVEPLKLDEIEDGAAKRDFVEGELLEHGRQGEDFGSIVLLGWGGHAAAHEAKKVEQGLGQEAGLLG